MGGLMIMMGLVVFVIILAFGGIVAAIILISKNKVKFQQAQDQYVRAEVVRTDNAAIGENVITRVNSYDHSQYFVEFRDDYNNKIVLSCSQNIYNTLLPGFYGDLVYRGTKLISFIRLNDHEENRINREREEGYFFEKSTNRTNPINFYCDAPSLGIKVPSDNPILLDDDEVVRYINRMFDNTTQNFFGLDNNKQVIQFFNEGNNDEIIIDIPDLNRNGSYQAIINGVNKLKSIVRAYYNDENVFEYANFEFMQF